MQPLILSLIVFFVNPLGLVYAQGNEPKDSGNRGTLCLEIREFRNEKGLVQVALFDKADGFPNKPDLAFRTATVPIKGGIAVVIFEEIPFGIYAVGVLHDENSNKKIDANLLGFPVEGYGTSKDARGTWRPPSFEDAKFVVGSDRINMAITISYRD